MTDLTVITVAKNDLGTLDLMIRSVIKFTYPSPKFIICDNTNGKNHERISKAMGQHQEYKIIDNNPVLKGGSNEHGNGLNKIFPHINTKYSAIIESDAVVLHKGWNEIRHGFKAKGLLKKEHLYHVCFFICETELGKKIDWSAGKEKERANNKSYSPNFDVGWDIKNRIRQDAVQLIEFRDCKSGSNIFGTMQSDEFLDNDIIIGAHFGRASNISGKANRKGFKTNKEQLRLWKEIVEAKLNE